jgi:hypothetical protein
MVSDMRTLQDLIVNGYATRGVPVRIDGAIHFVSFVTDMGAYLEDEGNTTYDPYSLIVDEVELSKIQIYKPKTRTWADLFQGSMFTP